MILVLGCLVAATFAQTVTPAPDAAIAVVLPTETPIFNLRPCSTNPKPYFCFLEGNTKNPAECPPLAFDAAKNFTTDMLKQYVNAPWFSQFQAPVSFQPLEQLFCTRAVYEPLDVSNITAGVQVINYANVGTNGPAVGDVSATSATILGIPDPDRPSKLFVGPKFLSPLPNFRKYYGDYWILAAGTTPGKEVDPQIGFTWAIVTSGKPKLKSDDGPGCRGFIFGDEGQRQAFTSQTLGLSATSPSEGAPAGAADGLFELAGPLLQELGFDGIEAIFAKIFEPTDPSQLDLAGLLALLEPLDLRPFLSMLTNQDVIEQAAGFVSQEGGGNVDVQSLQAVLQDVDMSNRVSVTDLVAQLLGVDKSTVTIFVGAAPTTAPDAVKEILETVRKVIIDIADSFFISEGGEGFWMFTREAVAPKEVVDEMFRVARRLGMDVNVLRPVVQDGCKYEGAKEKALIIPIV